MPFDPCREWLGIDAIELADPRRVLGVPSHVHDSDAITHAAASRLEALQRISPGPFAKAHAALVARVEEARDRLLAEARTTAAIPPVPASGGFRPPPQPTATGSTPASYPTQPAASDAAVVPLIPIAGGASRPSGRRRRSSGGGLLLGSVMLLGAAVVVLGVLVIREDRQGARTSSRSTDAVTASRRAAGNAEVAARPLTADPVDRPRRDREGESRVERATVRGATEAEQGQRAVEAQQSRTNAEDQTRRRVAEDRLADESRMRAEEEQRRVEQDRQRAEEERRRGDEERTQADRERMKRSAALDQAIGQAYAAIQREEFDTALRALTAADRNVGDDVEAATRLERWRLFTTYAKEFLVYREQAFAAANAGREFEADGARFAIIEIKPDLFVYKVAGRIERVPRDAVDPRIAMAVVAGWFAADGRAANHLFLGARWLSLDPPDVRRARREWQIAGDGGEMVAPLMALLDDPVIQRAGR